MGRKTCPIQDVCPKFDINGQGLDHWHRTHMPCHSFLDMTCQQSLDIQLFLGDEIACSIDKGKTAREKGGEK